MTRPSRYSAGVAALACAAMLLTGCGPVQGDAGSPPRGTAPSSSATTLGPTAAPSPTPTDTPAPTATPTKPAPVKVAALLQRGDRGEKVRELQHRLRQLDWYSGTITGRFTGPTVNAVRGFQGKRKLTASGSVDRKTWAALVQLTRTPTKAERHNQLVAGRAILKSGSQGARVRDLQARLKQIGWFSGLVTGTYGSVTVSAVRGFQAKRQIPVNGAVDQRTLDRLRAMTRTPTNDQLHNRLPKPSAAGLPSHCLTGRVMCISKRTNSLVFLVDGRAQLRVDVRFGSYETPTREGTFAVGWKSRHHVSTIYHTAMPYAMFFSGGQAVHYSSDFAARGYAGASHGCVNVRNMAGIQWLFAHVRVGDRVVVYR